MNEVRAMICLFVLAVLAAPLCAQSDEGVLEHNLEMARKYLSERNFRLAEVYARKVLAESPGDLSARSIIDEIARSTAGSPGTPVTGTGADSDESRLLAAWRNPDIPPEEKKRVGERLSDLYLERAQAMLKGRGHEVEALLQLRKSLVANEANGWTHYEMFNLFYKLGRLEESLPHASRFLELVGSGVVASDVRRKMVEVHVAIGDAAVKQSRWDKAARHYQAVLGLSPSEQTADETLDKLATALLTLFYQLHGAQQYVEAAVYLDRLMKIRPSDPAKRLEFDRKHFNRIRRYAPEVFWRAALELRKRRRFKRAVACLERLLQTGPSTKRRQEALVMKEQLLQEEVARDAAQGL